MKIKAEIIKINGKPNKNLRIYNEDSLEIIANQINSSEVTIMFGTTDSNNSCSLNELPKYNCGKANKAEVTDDSIIIYGEINEETFGGKLLKDITDAGLYMYLTPTGTGEVADDGTVHNYELISLSIVNYPAFDDLDCIHFIEE